MGIWSTLSSPTNPAYGDEDNLHMALAIMAVGDGFGSDTAQVMATLADTQDWPVYPLLERVLHPGNDGFCTTAPQVNGRARVMLDELPASADPACPGPGGPAPHGFTTHNRFIRGKSQAYVGPDGCDNIHYHGLDYMLLHNLYAIATPGTWEGSPDADPCAVLPGSPDAAPADRPDGGGPQPGEPDADPGPGADNDMPGGCGCATSRGGPSAPIGTGIVIVIALAWSVRRRR
jgi:MYXO-CTERM domain-containing protein